MTFLPSKSDKAVVPFVEAHEKAGAFAPIVNAMAVEAIANMHGESSAGDVTSASEISFPSKDVLERSARL